MRNIHGRNAGLAAGVLLASSATLLCCVLPAVLVAIGAGAALVGLVAGFPQLVWLSEHKAVVFGIAGVLLLVGGIVLWRARTLPCPVDPQAASQCRRLRNLSIALYWIALGCYLVGATFAFVLPAIGS